MTFIHSIKADKPETRDQKHKLTKFYKKGRTFFKAAASFATESIDFINPFLNILSVAGIISTPSTITHVQRGVTLTCSVIRIPNTLSQTASQVRSISKKKGDEVIEQVIKIASNVSDIALGVMKCFELGDTIVAIYGAISSSMGTGFKVVQGGVSAALSFIGVISAIELTKGLVDVGIESFKLYKTAKKISKNTKKMKIWTNMDWNDPTYVSNKLSRMKVKQIHTMTGLKKLEGALNTSTVAFNSSVLHVDKRWAKLEARKLQLKDKNAVTRLFGQVTPQIKLTVALIKKEAAEKEHLNTLKSFNTISEKHTLRTIKIRNFTIVEGKIKTNTLNERDRAVLEQFQKNQLEKLKTKRSNLKVEAIGHGLKIGIKVVIVISCIASIALTFSGVGTMPGIITNASIALFVMVAEYGLKKFKEYNPPKAWIPVKVPVLLEGADEKIERKAKALLAYGYSDQIKVEVANGSVILNGSVLDLTERDAIEEKLSTIDNVTEIINQIRKEGSEPTVEI